MTLDEIKIAISKDIENAQFTKQNWKPLYQASELSKIAILGQAPGLKAQEKNIIWDDASGDRLRSWLEVDKTDFYNSNNFALLPMDFYYPGKGKSADLPPRKNFAPTWHPLIFENLKELKLIILVGSYSQKFYLGDSMKENLTETVRSYKSYLPIFFPLIHPSPRNQIWQSKNLWFESEVLHALKKYVKKIFI